MYCISGRMWETCGIWPMLRSCGDGSVVRVENLPRCLTSCTLKTSSVGTIPHIFQGRTFGRGDFKTDTAVQSQTHSGQMFGNFVPWRHRIQEVFLLTKGLVSTICMHPTKDVIHLFHACRAWAKDYPRAEWARGWQVIGLSLDWPTIQSHLHLQVL